jgi:hypothetical protein
VHTALRRLTALRAACERCGAYGDCRCGAPAAAPAARPADNLTTEET